LDFDGCFVLQAGDGIRDSSVTGVQTCALPISTINLPSDDSEAFAELTLSSRSDARKLIVERRVQRSLIKIARRSHLEQRLEDSEIGRASCRERKYDMGVGGGRPRQSDCNGPAA